MTKKENVFQARPLINCTQVPMTARIIKSALDVVSYLCFLAGVRSLRDVDVKNIQVDPCNDSKGINQHLGRFCIGDVFSIRRSYVELSSQDILFHIKRWPKVRL